MGKVFLSNSYLAIIIVSFNSVGILHKVGAPRDNCNDLAPVILAFSNLVSLGGPIIILLSFEMISLSLNSPSASYILYSLFSFVVSFLASSVVFSPYYIFCILNFIRFIFIFFGSSFLFVLLTATVMKIH